MTAFLRIWGHWAGSPLGATVGAVLGEGGAVTTLGHSSRESQSWAPRGPRIREPESKLGD